MKDKAELERKVRGLSDAISKLHTAKHADPLLQIIHKPGFTGVFEHELVLAHTESLQSQVSGLHTAFDALINDR
jgi:hypothetical protein